MSETADYDTPSACSDNNRAESDMEIEDINCSTIIEGVHQPNIQDACESVEASNQQLEVNLDNPTTESVVNTNLTQEDTIHDQQDVLLPDYFDLNHITTDKMSARDINVASVPECSYTQNDDYSLLAAKIMPQSLKKSKVELFTEDTGPQMYNAKGSLVTAPIITKNLPKVFEYLPVFGKPQGNNLKEFYANKIREFVGCDLSDKEFSDLETYCSPDNLRTGKEIVMRTSVPVMGVVTGNIMYNNNESLEMDKAPNLCTLKKNKMRIERDTKGLFTKKLKYRGLRILPFTQEMNPSDAATPPADVTDAELEPGKDILYRVRVYRPYTYTMAKDRFTRTRHSVFCYDIILTGRHKLSALRDRFVCYNDFDMRVDVSNHPDMLPNTKAKEVFPSGFLFINNVFYVDTREGCVDYSEPIRAWAVKRNLGHFPRQDMCSVTLSDLVLKLGYPEVYVHQGGCEHVFLFSEVRLLGAADPPRAARYPASAALAHNQTVYCTTCAEFSAKWIVVGCTRVPFDPAFFCDICFKQYLYKDGQKIGDFKAYSYRGNALNVLKPQ